METLEYKYVDKSKWKRGEWDSEPDKIQYEDEETGFPCLIVRNNGGALCGYVGVSKEHPCFKKDYDCVSVDVHGGLTFSNFCRESKDNHGICHIPSEGEPDKVWWLGFDCAHLGDLSPAYENPIFDGDYKNINYVKYEIKNLAKQLKRLTPN